MKIDLSLKELNEALKVVNPIVPSRTTRPILNYVLLESSPKKCSLTATDLEIAISFELKNIKVEKEGRCLILSNRFSSICNELTGEQIHLELKENEVHLKARDSSFVLPSDEVEEFPELKFSSKNQGDIESHFLANMIRKTSFATATERSRYAMNGVHVCFENDQLSLTGTDGRRLANVSSQTQGKIKDFTAIVPTRALSLLQKVLNVTNYPKMKIEIDENQIVFHIGHVNILARLIMGRFPDYESVIPKSNKNILDIEKDKFEKVIRQAALVTSDDSKSIQLILSSEKLRASARTTKFGESNISEVASYKGDDIEVRFNPNYLLEGLKACDTDFVKFSLKDGKSPALLEEKKGSNFKYTVTPINVLG